MKSISLERLELTVEARIRAIATLACEMAKACTFSLDPVWFWKLAERQVDHSMSVGLQASR